MTKRILATVLIVVIAITANLFTASAVTPETDVNFDDIVVADYTYTSDATAGIRKISSTCVQGTSTYCFFKTGYTVTLYCNLQQFCNQVWFEYLSFSKTFTETGENAFAKLYTGLDAGLYRIHTVVEVCNSSGQLLEVVNVYSTPVSL